jgi:hypothetical protein
MHDGTEYYDIAGKTAPLVTADETGWTGSTAEMRQRAKTALFAMRNKQYENPDTGWTITIGRNAIDKTLNESGQREHFLSLEKLPELLRNAVLVRKSPDSKGRKEINAFYRLYAPIAVGGRIFAAQITVREDSDSNRRFYLQRLQIKNPAGDKGVSEHPYPAGQMPAAIMGDGSAETPVRSPGSTGSPVTISRLLRDVKSDDAPDATPG